MAIFDFLFKKENPEQKLLKYLEHKIEQAGLTKNLLKHDQLLAPMGFIGAIHEEQESLKNNNTSISKEYNISVKRVDELIYAAHNNIYKRYIE